MSELRYWLWLSTRRHMGIGTAFRLLDRFGTPEAIYFARDEEYKDIPGISAQNIETLCDKSLTESRDIVRSCQEQGFRIMVTGDADYPERLANISDPPLVLYVRGHLPELDDEAAIAVVGTRSCTPYGIKTAEKIGYEIARSGGLVVSGLARGIDSAAARGALRAGGRVVGVLGCGLDVVYPASNASLFDDVAMTGAIISEYPPKTEPMAANFPARNRILSGISVGVAVVEAPERSGALITAARALEQGRDVFAVPGNVDSDSCKGSNGLLREGAIAAVTGWDITESYAHLFPGKIGLSAAADSVSIDEEDARRLIENELSNSDKRRDSAKKVIDNKKPERYIDIMIKPEELSSEELAVISAIGSDSADIDGIIEKSGLPAQTVLSALTSLEILGAVRREAGKRFTSHISVK